MTTPQPGTYPRTHTTPGRANPAAVALALTHRLVLFAALQAAVAAALALAGTPDPWAASVAWWPVTATVTNLVGVGLLSALFRREGRRWRDLLRVEPRTAPRDALTTLALLVVGGVVAMGPNLGLAALLWGDPEAPLAVFIQPLPLWAALVALVGFPLTIALAELPAYYGYARPRLEALGLRPWAALGLAALLHGLQHAALPLVFEARFLAWRGLMFLPFALFVGAALRWRPRLLPYLIAAHALIDLTVGLMVWQASVG